MGDEPENKTLKQKALFYTTAFFVLLGTFSLFSFLFLVPFVIEPAMSTIFMQYDTNPAFCVTVLSKYYKGASNCSWTSCREGCTKEYYQCTQIYVNYKIWKDETLNESTIISPTVTNETKLRYERALREYDYSATLLDKNNVLMDKSSSQSGLEFVEYTDVTDIGGELMGNDSEWYFTGAKLLPNVKGCGYPPMLNCTIWTKLYKEVGTNFSCYYSKIDPGSVISDLDMWQNTLNLVYATAIPIPSFIISVIYLAFAYFKIYNEDEETVPLDENAEEIAGDEIEHENCTDNKNLSPISNTGHSVSGAHSPNSEYVSSFGHQLKVKMVDEMSRESMDGGFISNSVSLQGNLSKTMTTSISTQAGPIAAV